MIGIGLLTATGCSKEYTEHLVVDAAVANWQQSGVTAGLNIQSLITSDNYNFASGQTGTYKSTDAAANYLLKTPEMMQ